MVVAETPRVELLRAEWKQLQDSMPEKPALASAVADGPIIEQPVFMRGSHQARGEVVSKHFPIVLAGDDQSRCTEADGWNSPSGLSARKSAHSAR